MESGAPVTSPAVQGLAVAVRLEPSGPVAATEPILERDLADAHAETWWAGFARRGRADVPLSSVRFRCEPLRRDDGTCGGFVVEAAAPDGAPARRTFSRKSVDHVASRAVRRLLDKGVVERGTLCYFDLELSPAAAGGDREVAGVKVAAGGSDSELVYDEAALAPLLARAERKGAHDPDQHHLFFTREAHARAERVSRKGEADDPPIETGGVLIGTLCRCPETGDMFVVVLDVLEATNADGTKFSLSYSSRTWSRIQAVLRARAARPATRAHRLLGQVHGHNFMPAGEPCEACATAEVCGRSTAFLSADDLLWCRAVFHEQPWQVSVIYGLNARGEAVSTFYGQHAGELVPRGYHLIDDFPE